jgi:hypothetical protein
MNSKIVQLVEWKDWLVALHEGGSISKVHVRYGATTLFEVEVTPLPFGAK